VDVKEVKAAFDEMIEDSVPQGGDKLRMRVAIFRIVDDWSDALDRVKEQSDRIHEIAQDSAKSADVVRDLALELARLNEQVERLKEEKGGE
jgi:hypothetical protein